MKLTCQMELNVLSEKAQRQWNKLERKGRDASQREILNLATSFGQLIMGFLEKPQAVQTPIAEEAPATQGIAFEFVQPVREVNQEPQCGCADGHHAQYMDPMDTAPIYARADRVASEPHSSPRSGRSIFDNGPSLSTVLEKAAKRQKRFMNRFHEMEQALVDAGLLAPRKSRAPTQSSTKFTQDGQVGHSATDLGDEVNP